MRRERKMRYDAAIKREMAYAWSILPIKGGGQMTAKILVVDDDPNICELMRLYFQKAGFELFCAGDGSSALDLFRLKKPDLIFLDLMLPVINGREVCRLIRQKSSVPIIMLTARDTSEDKLAGFEWGADDYIVKPFDPLESVARARALLRRASTTASETLPDPQQEVIRVGSLTINANTYDVRLSDTPIPLKPKEFQLLLFLTQNPNRVFSRDQLLENVWGYDYGGETRTVDVHIKRLRQKIESPGEPWKIRTIWGVGYKFEVS
jgi:two-component system, OmpR family, response regulator